MARLERTKAIWQTHEYYGEFKQSGSPPIDFEEIEWCVDFNITEFDFYRDLLDSEIDYLIKGFEKYAVWLDSLPEVC